MTGSGCHLRASRSVATFSLIREDASCGSSLPALMPARRAGGRSIDLTFTAQDVTRVIVPHWRA